MELVPHTYLWLHSIIKQPRLILLLVAYYRTYCFLLLQTDKAKKENLFDLKKLSFHQKLIGYCNFVINCVRSYSSSYCFWSHKSGKVSNIAFIPPGADGLPPLPVKLLLVPGPCEKRSSNWSTPMLSILLFSLLITVLAVCTLNFCKL